MRVWVKMGHNMKVWHLVSSLSLKHIVRNYQFILSVSVLGILVLGRFIMQTHH